MNDQMWFVIAGAIVGLIGYVVGYIMGSRE